MRKTYKFSTVFVLFSAIFLLVACGGGSDSDDEDGDRDVSIEGDTEYENDEESVGDGDIEDSEPDGDEIEQEVAEQEPDGDIDVDEDFADVQEEFDTEPSTYSISDIQNPASGNRPESGEYIRIANVIVSHEPFSVSGGAWQAFFITTEEGGEWNAMTVVFNSAVVGVDVAKGDKLDMFGTFQEWCGPDGNFRYCNTEIVLDDYSVTGSGELPEALQVKSTGRISNGGSLSEKYQAALVELLDVAVTDHLADDKGFIGDERLPVNKLIYDFETPEIGAEYNSITGFLYTSENSFRLLPRNSDDFDAVLIPDGDSSENDWELSENDSDGDTDSDIEPELEVEEDGDTEWDDELEFEEEFELEIEEEADDPIIHPFGKELIINEFMNNPLVVEDAFGEWFSIYNTSDDTVFNLYGCSISNSGDNWHLIGESLPVQPGHEVVLGLNSDTFVNGGVTLDYEYEGFLLGNSSDAIRLKCDDETVDNVYYSSTTFDLVEGRSQNLDPLYHSWLANDQGANWCASLHSYGLGDYGTPGTDNSYCPEPDGDESEDDSPILSWPAMGDVVVTEIMLSPTAVSAENGQWIEIYNRSENDFDLEGCRIGNGTESAWHLISQPLPISAGSYAVLALNDDHDSNGGVYVDYAYDGFQLKSSGDDAVRLHCADVIVDEVYFSSSFWPVYSGRSMSLDPEMFNSADNDDSANWCRAIETYGDGDKGTPGEENTSCGVEDGDEEIEVEDDAEEVPNMQPAAGELILSEIMPWPMAVSDEAGEWFEMSNVSGRMLDLQGCRFSNSSDDNWMEISYSIQVGPSGRLVFASNEDYFSNGGLQVDFEWSGFELDDVSDSLRFYCGGTLVDVVAYTSTWPAEEGTALSLDPQHFNAIDNNFSENWCAATQLYGIGDFGSPGNANPDCDPTPDGDQDAEAEIDDTPGWPAPGQVIFTEIMNNPVGVDDSLGEWVELTNIGGQTFDLAGCEFANADNGNWTSISGSLLAGNMHKIVIGRSSNSAQNGGYTPQALFSFDLDDGSDTLRFRCGSQLIDSVTYGEGFPLSAGFAMNLSVFMFSDMENDEAANWCKATSTYGSFGNFGTPGSANILCEDVPDGDYEDEDEVVEDESDDEVVPHVGVYDIQDSSSENHPVPGSFVSVGPVTVTSAVFQLNEVRDAFFVSEIGGGFYSGMTFSYMRKKGPVLSSIGNSITCTGTYEEYCDVPGCAYPNSVLFISQCSIHSGGNPLPSPVVVASASPIATGGYLTDALQGVLVSLEDVSVSEEMDANGEWIVDDSLIVDDMFGYSYAPQLNERIVTLTGFLHTSNNEYKLEPRDDGDIELESGSCINDEFEPNENRDEAVTVAAGNFNDIMICEDDSDWFALNLNGGDQIKIDIYFRHADGNLDLYLLSATAELDSSQSETDNEHLIYTVANSGTYYIKVIGLNGDVNAYDMSVNINGDEGFVPSGNIPVTGDLVITEFLADAASNTDGDAQWFEIYNPSPTTTYNLEGIRIINGDGSMEHEIINGGALYIAPASYMLFAVSGNPAQNGGISPHYVYTGFIMKSANDGIRLYNPFDDEMIDEVSYSESAGWYVFESFAMNLDPLMFDAASNDIADNWCYAAYVYGGGNFGTPGAANRSCGVIPDGDSDGEVVGEPPLPGECVITEFMKNPAAISDADGEWFEIYNADPNNAHEIGGCIISSGEGESHEIQASIVLRPGEFAVLARNGNSSVNGGIMADYVYGDDIQLGNDSDEIVLICNNIEIDRVDYTDSFGDVEGRANMLDPRFLNAVLNNFASYWCTSSQLYDNVNGNYGTPGAQNDHNCY